MYNTSHKTSSIEGKTLQNEKTTEVERGERERPTMDEFLFPATNSDTYLPRIAVRSEPKLTERTISGGAPPSPVRGAMALRRQVAATVY